jgi:SagB-type dehydrogenase family enzyme
MKLKFFIALLCIVFGFSEMNAQPLETIKLPAPQKTGGMSLMEALANRQSQRSYSSRELTQQQMSNLLWAAYGVNRPNGYRTAPSARAVHEYDIYIIKNDGWYVYDADQHAMLKMGNENLQEHAGSQDYVQTAPVNLVFVADFDRMEVYNEEMKVFYSATNVGFISQNIYLWCASEGLGTVVRGLIDKGKAKEVLKLRPNQQVILAQTVGYTGE